MKDKLQRSTVDYPHQLCYNIDVKEHTTNQKRLGCTISKVDTMMQALVGLLMGMRLSILESQEPF